MSSRDVLAPGIEQFAARLAADYARHADFSSLSHLEQRRIAETVRAPWREGGPAMQQITDLALPETELKIRIYDPGEGEGRPGLVYLHGGGWTFFSVDTHDRLMREYAARSGFVVIGVDYPLSPEAKFPTALDHVVDVVGWLSVSGPDYGVSPDRLAIGGDSAGANLALATCLRLRDRGEGERIGALLLNYGAFDVVCSNEAERRYGGFTLNRAEMDVFWANYLPSPEVAANPLACPLNADLRGMPPTFLTIPELDILSEQSLLLAERLRAVGVSVRAECYVGATHSFLEAVEVADVANRALTDGAGWLNQTLDKPSDAHPSEIASR